MIAVATITKDWMIGQNHQPIPVARLAREFFDELTNGKVVVYDPHTLKNLPNQRPLKNRKNIILSHQRDIDAPDATIATTLNELQFILRSFEPNDVFLIGGTTLFPVLIDQCSSAMLTIFTDKFEAGPNAEFFPRLDQYQNWIPGHTSCTHFFDGHQFYHQQYVNTIFRRHATPTSQG